MLVCAATVALSLAGAAGSADAVVVSAATGHGYGVTPLTEASQSSLLSAYAARRSSSSRPTARRFDELPFGGSELENAEGGPVMHSATTHLIYWDPGSQFTATTKGIVGNFFTDVAGDSGLATNVFGIAGQYTDASGHAAYSSTFGGALVDSHAYPTAGDCTAPTEVDNGPPYTRCLFDGQLQAQLTEFITKEGLPKGPTQLYFVLLPHNVATCFNETREEEEFFGKICSNNFFCAYHSWINPGPNEIIYADIPFSLLDTEFAKGCQADGNAKLQLPNGDKGKEETNAETRYADVALKYISHEYIEAVTDPLVGLRFHTAWVDGEGLEIGDKCNGVPFGPEEEGRPGFDKHAFTPTLGGSPTEGTLFNQSIHGGSFYLQSEWDNAGEACLMKPLSLGAGAFSPPSGTAGSSIAFHATAEDRYGDLEPDWEFGDGTVATGTSVGHTYATPGEYTVTMSPKDGLTGSTGAAVSHTITVAPAPSGGGGETGGGGGGETGGGGGGGAGGGGTGGGGAGTGVGSGSGAGSGGSLTTPAGGTLASTTTSPTATVTLAGSAISINSKGAGAVKLSCAGTASCAGTLTIVVKTPGKHGRSVKIGSASFSIAAGTTKSVAVKLSAIGRSLLKAGHGHIGASLTIVKSSPAPQSKLTRAVRLSQKR